LKTLNGFRLLLLDDHALFREGLVMALNALEPGCEVLAVATPLQARALLDDNPHRFDLVLIDFKLPGSDGLSCAKALRLRHPIQSFGLISGEDDPSLPRRAREAGMAAFLSKSLCMSDLLEALRQLAQGEPVFCMGAPLHAHTPPAHDFGLTPRQLAVLKLLATGESNKAIAQTMGVSPATVKNHLDAIFEKMGVTNRLQAVMLARASLS
jgi:DNA-binding NarL/FixJ family response regulator